MRILLLSDVYFPRVNGVSTSIQTFAREFTQKGIEVTLIAPEYPADYSDDFEIIRIPSRYLPMDPEDRLLKPSKIRALIPDLQQRHFDLLHIHTPFVAHYAGLNLAKKLDIPVIESYHTFFEEYLDKYLPLIPRQILRFIARRFSSSQCNSVDSLVVPSQAMLDVLRDYGVTNQAAVIPTGIKLDQFHQGNRDSFREKFSIPESRPVLVHVGRIAYEKNIDFLIKVLDRVRRVIPDVLLVIAGEGPAKASLERQVAEQNMQDNVLFVGYLSRDGELQNCYASGDAFIFASRTETQGLVLLEAMALGVPVVSTAVMGTKEVLADGKGSLIAEENLEDFAEKTVKILQDHDLRARLASEAAEYAKEWTAPVLADKMLDFYQSIIEQRQHEGLSVAITDAE